MEGTLQTSNFQLPRIVRGNFQYEVIRNFDADWSPENPVNQEAARQRGLVYDHRDKVYRDEDGCLIRDRFGQPLG